MDLHLIFTNIMRSFISVIRIILEPNRLFISIHQAKPFLSYILLHIIMHFVSVEFS